MKIKQVPNEQQAQDQQQLVQTTERELVSKGTALLQKYRDGKKSFDQKIIDNEEWYRRNHWSLMRNGKNTSATDTNKPEPASAWLFNAIANKHADAMDNYPEVNTLPRQRDDEQEAKRLSSILPVIFARNEFEQTYNDAWWYKLKNGICAYGEFWNPQLENGLGDIDITNIDMLNIFWEPGIKDIQKSSNLFIVNLVDDDILKASYPDVVEGSCGNVIDIPQYKFDDTVDTTGKSLVVDWYDKTNVDGKNILHLTKFVGSKMLFSSKVDPLYIEDGFYKHGMYPVVFDILFPEEGTPVGFGYVDICRDPQMYIDKLDQIIMTNSLQSGTKRWFVKENANFNADDYADWSKPFVKVSGSLEDINLKEIQVSPLDAFIVQHKLNKIEELKETAGNRDFSQGGTSGGVTAASAIAVLQEAGSKLSRDMIKASYRAFNKLNNIAIELIREFYDNTREFRIDNPDGTSRFEEYNNSQLKGQVVQNVQDPTAEAMNRLPVFDINIKAQKANPFSRMAQNELAKELFKGGIFNPQMAESALICLDMMDFEGKEKVIEQVKANAQMAQQLQQAMLMLQTLQGGIPNGAGGNQMPGQQA